MNRKPLFIEALAKVSSPNTFIGDPWFDKRSTELTPKAHHDSCHPEPVEGWIPAQKLCGNDNKKSFARASVCCLLFAAYSLLFAAGELVEPCFAEELASVRQAHDKAYETQYVTIHYSEDSDIATFTRNIGRGLQIFGESQKENPLLAKNRVDAIVERVEQILDMYPSNLHFKIYIYPAYKELSLKYLATGSFGKSPVAFYNHKTRAIYLSLSDTTDGVLAHEIGHAVINFFFPVPPPARMQEILAQYVDKHLWEGK